MSSKSTVWLASRRALLVLGIPLLLGCERDPGAQLREAASNGDVSGVKLALQNGAGVDSAVQGGGKTALMGACYFSFGPQDGHTEIVRLLIASGADVNRHDGAGNTPLIAAVNVQKQVVSLLLEAGADPNAPGADGWTALMYASKNGDLETVRLLLKYHAKINLVSGRGQTATSLAKSFSHIDIVRLLSISE